MSKGTPVRTVRVPDDLWDAAVAKAEAEDTNVRAVIVALLRQYVMPHAPRRRGHV